MANEKPALAYAAGWFCAAIEAEAALSAADTKEKGCAAVERHYMLTTTAPRLANDEDITAVKPM